MYEKMYFFLNLFFHLLPNTINNLKIENIDDLIIVIPVYVIYKCFLVIYIITTSRSIN